MKWIAVKDRLPEDKPHTNEIYLTCDKTGFVFINDFFGDGFYKLENNEWVKDENIEYWMELPLPPEK